MTFENEGERIARVGKILEKYPRKPNPPIGWDRPTPEDFARLDEVEMKQQDSLPLKEQPIKSDPVGTDAGSAHLDRGVGPSPDLASKQETPVAATPNVPTPVALPAIEPRAKGMAKPFEVRAAEITDRTKRLRDKLTAAKGVIRPHLLEEAKELDADAIRFLADVGKSELRRDADTFNRWHKLVTGMIGSVSRPANGARQFFNDVRVAYDRQERSKIAEQQRRNDEAAEVAQKAEREAEVQSHVDAGRVEEAAVLAEESLPPVQSAPVSRETLKVEGTSLVYSVKVDEESPFSDTAKFAAWLIEHHEHLRGMEFKVSYWKTLLTAHLNKDTGAMSMTIPGLNVRVAPSSRHRTAGE
jgi:hypothetical protein